GDARGRARLDTPARRRDPIGRDRGPRGVDCLPTCRRRPGTPGIPRARSESAPRRRGIAHGSLATTHTEHLLTSRRHLQRNCFYHAPAKAPGIQEVACSPAQWPPRLTVSLEGQSDKTRCTRGFST